MQINDAVHGVINIKEPYALKIINSELFKRLTNLKQQGHTYLVFPNANHHRYSHTLGVYRNMKLISSYGHLNEYEHKLTICSALLHDIGHGPFSHAFEEVTKIHHETMSIMIIRNSAELQEVFRK